MSRKTDLEQNIRESYNLISEFENILRVSNDPQEKARCLRAIAEQRQLIKGYLEEYILLCERLGISIPADVLELAVAGGISIPQRVPATATAQFTHEEVEQRSPPQATGQRSIRPQAKRGSVESVRLLSLYALVIGVGEYIDERFPNLPATVRDARAIVSVLTDPTRCGYPPANVRLLTGEQATGTSIRAALHELAERSTAESTIFIYFSGHGGRAYERGQWKSYLCPCEADPDDFAHTAISGEEFSALLAAIPARRLLVVLDACHAGGAAELKAADGAVVWKAGLPESYYEALAQGSGRVVLASSKEEQFSYVHGELSLFTHHLVRALSGGAAVRNDGLIHVLDVFHYVNEAVSRDEPEQMPVLKVKDLDLNFPIALDRGGKGIGAAAVVPGIEAIREQIVRDPIAGARALSEYLAGRPEWAAKRAEVDLKRGELESIQHDMELFGYNRDDQSKKNRAVFFLLKVCTAIEQGTDLC